jgi:hypothetical protein
VERREGEERRWGLVGWVECMRLYRADDASMMMCDRLDVEKMCGRPPDR